MSHTSEPPRPFDAAVVRWLAAERAYLNTQWAQSISTLREAAIESGYFPRRFIAGEEPDLSSWDGVKPTAVTSSANPEQPVLDVIDELVNESLTARRYDDYTREFSERCVQCHGEWHGQPRYGCPGAFGQVSRSSSGLLPGGANRADDRNAPPYGDDGITEHFDVGAMPGAPWVNYVDQVASVRITGNTVHEFDEPRDRSGIQNPDGTLLSTLLSDVHFFGVVSDPDTPEMMTATLMPAEDCTMMCAPTLSDRIGAALENIRELINAFMDLLIPGISAVELDIGELTALLEGHIRDWQDSAVQGLPQAGSDDDPQDGDASRWHLDAGAEVCDTSAGSEASPQDSGT